jgi:transcription termination factor NusB
LYTLQTEAGYFDNGTYNICKNLSTDIVVDKDAAIAIGDIINTLKVLPVTGKDKLRINKAIRYMKNVQKRVIVNDQDIEKNIHKILMAIDSMLSVTSTDTSTIRLMLDELLKMWEGRVYLRDFY